MWNSPFWCGWPHCNNTSLLRIIIRVYHLGDTFKCAAVFRAFIWPLIDFKCLNYCWGPRTQDISDNVKVTIFWSASMPLSSKKARLLFGVLTMFVRFSEVDLHCSVKSATFRRKQAVTVNTRYLVGSSYIIGVLSDILMNCQCRLSWSHLAICTNCQHLHGLWAVRTLPCKSFNFN